MEEQKCGAFVKNPVGVLQVKKDSTGYRNNFVTKGTQKVINVARKITGRDPNVLQVKSQDEKNKDPRHFYKNKEDIPENRLAKPSPRDFNLALSVSSEKEE